MKTRTRSLVAGIALSFPLVSGALLSGCATTGASAGQTALAVAESDLGKAGISVLATKVGVNPAYVQLAMGVAQSLLGNNAQASADQKASAAQAGVDKAATQAQADGTPLSANQKLGLVDGLKTLL